MLNQFFDPGFVFDFCSDMGSTATPSARSNVSWCGLRKFRSNRQSAVFAFFPCWSPLTVKLENVEKQFSAVW